VLLGHSDIRYDYFYSTWDGQYWLSVNYYTIKGHNFDPYIVIKHVCGAVLGCEKLRYTHYFSRDQVTHGGEPKYKVKHSLDLLSVDNECI